MANNPEQEKKELDKKIKEILSQIRELDKRLSYLQSNGFQLGSFYLVFQGVILTAIANANSVFGCLSYWLLIALSSLAAFPNLFALYYIGGEYIRISSQRDKSLRKSDLLFTRLAKLSEPNPTSSPGTSPFVSAPTSPAPPVAGTSPFVSAPTSPAPPVAGTSPFVSAPTSPSPPSPVAGTAPLPSPVAATAPPPPAGNHGYTSGKSMVTRAGMRIIFVVFCIAFYLGVSAIMYLVCIKTLRKPGAQCKQH